MMDRYHIIRLISKDQLGGTYLAEDKELERNIAFRHFDIGHNGEQEPDWEGKFTQYVTKLNSLQQPNLIAIYDFDIDDGHPVIITQFIEADTIAECLQREALGVIETVNMALDLLTGLQAAHAIGIYHGAMHTGSVKRLALPDGGYQYMIIDLGWKHLSSIVMGEEIHLEDPILIPPKIFGQTDSANAQFDLFMIGQLCFTTLAGGHPFAEYTAEQCASAYQESAMPRLDTYADNIPSQLTDWISSMTMRDPRLRPASAQEAIASLRAIDLSKTSKQSPSLTSSTIAPHSASQSLSLDTPKATAIKNKTSWWQQKSVKITILFMIITTTIIVLALNYNPIQDGKPSSLVRNQEMDNLAKKPVAILLPTKMINTIKNRKKPVIVPLETARTLDWLVTKGAPAEKRNSRRKNGKYNLNLLSLNGIREFEFKYNPIRFKLGAEKIHPRAATDTQHHAKIGQGWKVDLRPPKNHRGPLIVTFYMTQWNCDIDFEITDQNTKETITLTVPCTENGVVEIPVQIPNAEALTFITIKAIIASIHPKNGCTMGLNGIKVMKP